MWPSMCAEKMVNEDASLITIYYGADVAEGPGRRAVRGPRRGIPRLRRGGAERRPAAVLLSGRGGINAESYDGSGSDAGFVLSGRTNHEPFAFADSGNRPGTAEGAERRGNLDGAGSGADAAAGLSRSAPNVTPLCARFRPGECAAAGARARQRRATGSSAPGSCSLPSVFVTDGDEVDAGRRLVQSAVAEKAADRGARSFCCTARPRCAKGRSAAGQRPPSSRSGGLICPSTAPFPACPRGHARNWWSAALEVCRRPVAGRAARGPRSGATACASATSPCAAPIFPEPRGGARPRRGGASPLRNCCCIRWRCSLLRADRARGRAAEFRRMRTLEDFWKRACPFRPPGAQRRVLSRDGARSAARTQAMARLVQGDVGCGKTAIAFGGHAHGLQAAACRRR